MPTNSKVLIKKFLDIKNCEKFINDSCKNKKVVNKEITFVPNVGSNNIVYFVVLEYVLRGV